MIIHMHPFKHSMNVFACIYILSFKVNKYVKKTFKVAANISQLGSCLFTQYFCKNIVCTTSVAPSCNQWF